MARKLTEQQLELRRLAASKGGLARAKKFSHEQLSSFASKGGRPRNLTIADIQAIRLENKEVKEEKPTNHSGRRVSYFGQFANKPS